MSDAIFWDRLAEMPLEEQEQELVLRREHVVMRIAVLKGAGIEAKARKGGKEEAARLGVAIFEDSAQLTAINERIKYLRRVLDSTSWRTAVKTVLGEDAYEQVLAWRIQTQNAAEPARRPA